MSWKNHTIYKREDGSFVILKDEMFYHVPNEGEFAPLYQEVAAYAKAHPDQVLDDYVPPMPTLDDVKAEAKAWLLRYRQDVEYGGFELDGQRWDSEQKDELRLNSAFRIFETGITEYPGWKISDGTYVTLTPELLARAVNAMMVHYGTCFAVEQVKRAEIDALTSVEEVYSWLDNQLPVGW